ncbi:MAG TPA: PP2C family protein-serine/threonine phosphatase [Terracidiphilus sp.]
MSLSRPQFAAYDLQMLPGKSGLLLLFTVLPAVSAGILSHAQPVQSPSAIRYEFGDDPDGKLGWANPNFDDGAWTLAENGFVPSGSRDTSRFLWVRMRVQVPENLNVPLALHLEGLGVQPMTWQIFVNGQALGGQGTFPPHADPADPPLSPVMTLPLTLAPPGSVALIALREWRAPAFIESGVPSRPEAVLNHADVLNLAVRAAAADALIASGPEYAFCGLLALAGLALLLFWRYSRGREYLWAAVMLLSPLATAILSTAPVAASLSFHTLTLVWAVVYAAGLVAEIEFMWALFGLRSSGLRILWHSLWIVVWLAEISETYFMDSPTFLHLCHLIIVSGILAFDCILFTVCIREMFRPGGNRAIAAAQSTFEVIVLLGVFGYSVHLTLGPFPLDLWNLAIMFLDLAIAAMLFRRAWKAWKESSSLHAEFEAAREVQQQLVAPAADIPGFKIQSVYAPAKHVGGDFFRIAPDSDGSVLLVFGDVSGKGLKAAMTVSAIMGALRGCTSRQPAAILHHLNGVLFGQIGGFVTCCATLIAADGSVTLANAGNPAPYHNGHEMRVEAGLPLGLLASATYVETCYQLAPNDRLIFVSDGVLEATNPQGELYGFERTEAISTESAETVVQAAQAFGQDDDITVLTLMRQSVGAPANTIFPVTSLSA